MFYSVLMGRAAMYDMITVFTCFVAIVTVSGLTPLKSPLCTRVSHTHAHSCITYQQIFNKFFLSFFFENFLTNNHSSYPFGTKLRDFSEPSLSLLLCAVRFLLCLSALLLGRSFTSSQEKLSFRQWLPWEPIRWLCKL